MLAISIPSNDQRLHTQMGVNINGRTSFLMVTLERFASFYRIYDRGKFPCLEYLL